MQLKVLNRWIIATCLLGIYISTYAIRVEVAAETKPGYKALCDFSAHSSCSRVLTSKYSKALGLTDHDSLFKVPNSVYGIIFYSIILLLSTFDNKWVAKGQIFLSISSCAVCIYLAYLLVFVLRDFCIVCVSTYFINILITYLVTLKHNNLIVNSNTKNNKKNK